MIKKLTLFAFPLFFSIAAFSATFTVTSTSDAGAGTLRDAITQANGNGVADIIDFNIPGTAPFTLTLATPLPALTEAGTVIDGGSYTVGTSPNIILDGTTAGGDGINIKKEFCEIYGLLITNFDIGINIDGFGSYNIVLGAPGKGNVINNNASHGIAKAHTGAGTVPGDYYLTVKSSYIGVDFTGTTIKANGGDGIYIDRLVGSSVFMAPPDTVQIGGLAPGEGNIISGNANDGIFFDGVTGKHFLRIQNNLIGTDVTGTVDLGNGNDGFDYFEGNIPEITIEGNVVSGNGKHAFFFSLIGPGGGGKVTITFKNNMVGTDITGTKALANDSSGFVLRHYHETAGTFSNNVISNNGGDGIHLVKGLNTGKPVVIFENNFIGTDVTGTVAMGNKMNGIIVKDFYSPTLTFKNNVIANNTLDGIHFLGTLNGTANIVLRNNKIGTDITGTVDFGNGGRGFYAEKYENLTATLDSNVISGNGSHGVHLGAGNANTTHLLTNNKIGTDITGTQNLGNDSIGVFLDCDDAVVGDASGNKANIIAYNGMEGVVVEGGTQNEIRGNSIFCNNQIGGSGKGILLTNGGNNNIAAPAIDSVEINYIAGTAPANAVVEFFVNGPCCEAKTFIGSAVADPSGAFLYLGTVSGGRITATATLAADGTSEISNCKFLCKTPATSFTTSSKLTCDGLEIVTNNTTIGIAGETVTYLWTVSDGFTSTAKNFTHTITAGGTSYTVTLEATIDAPCPGTATETTPVMLFDLSTVVIPNVFTPNNDGTNDYFELPIPDELKNCASVKVFNRWGLLVHENANEVYWDGKNGGTTVADGTYFYTIEIGGFEYNGSITIFGNK